MRIIGKKLHNIEIKVVPCLPYQVSEFPWSTYFPEWDGNEATFYNDPALDGASLNINLGGYENSWTGSGVYTYFMNPSYLVGGAWYNFEGNDYINLSQFAMSFYVDDPTVLSRYSAVGGNAAGTVNISPGHHVYPGVATFSPGFSGGSFLQARNFGQPIICEMWYSLNAARSQPLVGYGNYSFFGDCQNNNLPWVEFANPSNYVKKYQAGVFPVTADMYNLTDADFIAGVSYVGNSSGGTAKIIVNGIVVSTVNVTSPVVRASGTMDFITSDSTFAQMQTSKSNVNYIELALQLADSSSPFVYYGNYYPYNDQTEGLIDTYLCKYAWIVDTETGNVEDNPIYSYPPSFYTLPNIDLTCAPISEVPNYVPPLPI